MKISFLFSMVVLAGFSLAQSSFVTQVTDYNYDSKNPDILAIYPFIGLPGKLVFEIH